ncbi:MAG: hypothetical protein LW852_12710, partial [Sediminibacterium sp.]|nr:hypothetical protein [Sediminibacterium sp.]
FFHYFFNNWKFVASAKVRAEHVRKLLNDVEKTISLLHLSIENTIQSNNTFQLENHINNDFTNLNLDHLINLVTSDGDEKIDINDLSKLMNWKTDQKGRILMTTKEFVVWSIIPIIMEYAEVKGEKENIYIKTLAKSINFKLGSIDSIKVTKSKAKDNENEKLYEVIDLFFRKIRRNMGK